MKIRLAHSFDDLLAAQRLRYQIFHEELGATSGDQAIDHDRFDPASFHLLAVEDGFASGAEFPLHDGNLVGTCRLLTQAGATDLGGFYSASEFDLVPLLDRNPGLNFLELGRSCVLKRCRGAQVIELLWQGIWDFVRENRVDVLIGCASFPGIDPTKHVDALSFLFQNRPATGRWQCTAKTDHAFALTLPRLKLPNQESILRSLPPLVKGYWRLGAMFGEGAVIDRAFNTLDVLIVLPIAEINPRFFKRFGVPVKPL